MGVVFSRWTDTPPKINDKFFQIRLNSGGTVYYRIDSNGGRHYERLASWIVKEATRVYGDDGGLIYYRSVVKKDTTWLNNTPGNKKY